MIIRTGAGGRVDTNRTHCACGKKKLRTHRIHTVKNNQMTPDMPMGNLQSERQCTLIVHENVFTNVYESVHCSMVCVCVCDVEEEREA